MTLRRALTAAGLVLGLMALGTCSNPISLLEKVGTEVKIANKKFLVVNSITPEQGATNVNPGVYVTVVFDRELDQTTISESSVTITPAVSLDFSYTAATKTLQITADPFMEDLTSYTVRLAKGLKGSDGSELLEEQALSFTTGEYPAGNVTINSGDPLATNSTTVTLYFTWKPIVDKYRYSLVSAADLDSKSWVATDASVDAALDGSSDGTKTVWVQYRDDNTSENSTVQSDSIILDRTAPSVSSFSINTTASSTTSTSVTLNNSVSDLTPMQMRFQNVTGSWSTWENYSASKAWTLVNSVGTRVVNAEFRDMFGYTASASDPIIYGVVTVQAATLNTTPTAGTVMVTWGAATADTGTNYYYVYRRAYPGGGKPVYTYLGRATTTGATSLTVSGVPEGTLYYFDVRIYNTAVDGYGSYSTTSKMGFTADVTIVYNDGNSTDTELATRMQSILTTDLANHPTYGASIDGTMPTWTVMLVPQSQISATTYDATYRSTVVGGHPIILTPGVSYHSDPEWVRNVVMHDRGVFAMGYGGTRLLDTVNANFSTWAMTGTKPTDIGLANSSYYFTSIYITSQTSGNSVWSSPLYSSSIPGGATPTDNARVQMGYSGANPAITRISVYKSNDANPTDGWLYGKEDLVTYPSYTHNYPVVRQGRFLHFGFTREPDRPFTGWVYLVNLVHRMGATYF